MKPAIPPEVVRLLTGLSFAGLAERLDVCSRTAVHFCARPWTEWEVGYAEKFCALAGLDFWNLSMDDNPALRAAFARAPWDDLDSPVVRRAVDSLILTQGETPTDDKRRKLSNALIRAFRT